MFVPKSYIKKDILKFVKLCQNAIESFSRHGIHEIHGDY